jgi:hypothetical protein
LASRLTGGNEAAIGAASQLEGNKTMSNTPNFYAYAVKDRCVPRNSPPCSN